MMMKYGERRREDIVRSKGNPISQILVVIQKPSFLRNL